jgi:outer membrane murein-binding lipoprotein Lpp
MEYSRKLSRIFRDRDQTREEISAYMDRVKIYRKRSSPRQRQSITKYDEISTSFQTLNPADVNEYSGFGRQLLPNPR